MAHTRTKLPTNTATPRNPPALAPGKPAEPRLERIIRKRDLPQYTGLRPTAIDDAIAAGRFPRPIKLGLRAVGWRECDLLEWQLAGLAASTNNK
ncbi:MAG TPA: AlpA family phage regulatory protein [Xanthobacteraceae bacterium]|nr:AlpA family phage regulatory protein [Xanthobacteraceae bacterium]